MFKCKLVSLPFDFLVFRFSIFAADDPSMRVTTHVGELMEQAVERAEARGGATEAQPGNRISSVGETISELSTDEAEVEGFVAGDDLGETF